MIERPGTYWYMLPQSNQARTAIWEAINPYTKRRRIDDFFPPALFDRRETDMMIKCKSNASTWQVKGSDNYGAGIGSPPVGVVMSEYSQADPLAWSYLSPILIENDGWAIFPSTPRGHNHLERMLNIARSDQDWFGQVLTIDDTQVISRKALADDLRDKQAEHGEILGKALWEQEWYCSFNAAVPGSYYGDVIEQMENDGRIGIVPHEPRLPVVAAFDLGHADATAIWFAQAVGLQIRIVDYHEESGISDLAHYAKVLRSKPYSYGKQPLILPHDAEHERLGQSMSIRRQFQALGFDGKLLPQSDIDPGIRAGRQLLQKCYIDATKCAKGLDALRQYHRKYDDNRKAYSDTPTHDWSSHGADAWRYLAIGYEPSVRPEMESVRAVARAARQQQKARDPWSLPNR